MKLSLHLDAEDASQLVQSMAIDVLVSGKVNLPSITEKELDLVTLESINAVCIYCLFNGLHIYLFICSLLCSRANRQGLNISFTVCFLYVCTVTDFSAEDKVSGVKFCSVFLRRPGQGMSHFGELCSPRSQKSDELASA